MAVCPFGSRRTSRWIPWLSISLPLLGWLVFGLYPSLATTFYSFTQYAGIPGTPLSVCGICNYRSAFTLLRPELSESLRVTIEYVVVVTVLQTAIGLVLALLLRRRGTVFAAYRALVFMPQVFSVTVVGTMFSLLLDPYSGPVGQIVQHVFHRTVAILGSNTFALPAVMLVNVWMWTGFTMLVYIAGLRNIPPEVHEASAIDGAGRWRRFHHITWPLLAPATTVNVFLAAMGSLGEYALVLVLTHGNFGTQTIGLYMFNSAFGSGGNYGYGAMLAMLQFVLTLIVGGGLLYLLRRREVSL